MTRTLPGVVATVVSPQDATDTERAAVIAAAVAYVAAWKDWDQGKGYAPKYRQALHCAQRELVAAVEGLGEGAENQR